MQKIINRIIGKPAAGGPTPVAGDAWAPAALALLMLLNLAGCSSVKTFQIESRPPEHQVVIDGQADDWAGRLFVVENQKVSLGFLNDRDYLYICLRTDDRTMQRELLRSGLTVWIDARGKRAKALGIKYPIGLRSYEQRMWRDVEPEEVEAPGEVAGNLTDVEIYRQGNPEPESLDIADAEGLELKAAATGRNFIYELKVPLATVSPGYDRHRRTAGSDGGHRVPDGQVRPGQPAPPPRRYDRRSRGHAARRRVRGPRGGDAPGPDAAQRSRDTGRPQGLGNGQAEP